MKLFKMTAILLLMAATLVACAEGAPTPDSSDTVTTTAPIQQTTENQDPSDTSAPTSEADTAPADTTAIDLGNIVPDAVGIDFALTQQRVCDNKIAKLDYMDFYRNAEATELVVPALAEYFVPQGIDYWDEMGWFIISGYFKPTDFSAASYLVAVDAATGKYVGEYKLLDVGGGEHTRHDGGVAITEMDLYISNGYKLFRIPLEDIKQAGNCNTLTIAEEISVPVSASFCNYSNGVVWVGEFYEKSAYPLKGEHVNKNNDGDTYNAWAVGYKLDPSAASGLESTPSYVISIPEKIQGMTVTANGTVVLSQSYGRRNKSAVYTVAGLLDSQPSEQVAVDGVSVPLWFADEAAGLDKTVAIPMAEGCCAVGNDVYILFESGAYYYRAYSATSVAKDPTDVLWKFKVK